MARSGRRTRSLATFTHPVRVEVRRPELQLLASVRQLDVERLARAARAEFEVGYFQAGDCRQLVRAVVRRGMVTGLTAEPCTDDRPERASPELARLLNAARRRAAPPGRPPRFPMPVAAFLHAARAVTIRTITCMEICVLWTCIYCCNRPDNPKEWICGRKITIDTT